MEGSRIVIILHSVAFFAVSPGQPSPFGPPLDILDGRGSWIYSYEADRTLTVFHHLAGLGHSYNVAMEYMHMQQNELRDMAGESFAAPCVGVCMLHIASIRLPLGGNPSRTTRILESGRPLARQGLCRSMCPFGAAFPQTRSYACKLGLAPLGKSAAVDSSEPSSLAGPSDICST